MTELTITPKVLDKTARFKGTVAAGEHVAVTIKGGAEWLGEDDGANLTLRVLDLVTGRTLAVFPRPSETVSEPSASANAEPDSWTTAGDDNADLYCELNLNTTRMVAAARHMLRVPVLFVLGDTDDPRTLYFRDRYEIEYWPERIGDTVPYDLDKWPKQIDDWTELVTEWQEQMSSFGAALSGHTGNGGIHVTAEQKVLWTAKQDAINDLDTIRSGAAAGATAIQRHQDISGKIDRTEILSGGKVKESLLPSYVDDVLEYASASAFPATGEIGKIYVAKDENKTYRWSGTQYVQIGGGGSSVTIDPSLSSTSENPVQNKAVTAALSQKLDISSVYPEWIASPPSPYQGGARVSHAGRIWQLGEEYAGTDSEPGVSEEWVDVLLQFILDLKQDLLSSAQLAAANSGVTAAKVATWDGYAAQIEQKASFADLPYALVTPGEWEFSGVPEGVADVVLSWTGTAWDYTYAIGTIAHSGRILRPITEPPFDGNELSLTFSIESSTITATRPSLPGHLCDRAGNRVVVTGDTTLTLPEIAHAGRLRDFLVRLAISGSTVPTITFAAPTGETITYETDGDEFPVPDEAGDWLYSFTESCVAHTFAVSLKKVNVVTQGGS